MNKRYGCLNLEIGVFSVGAIVCWRQAFKVICAWAPERFKKWYG